MSKVDKQINALLYAIKKYPKIGRTKLMKFVFLIDFGWYNENGETLLEDEYIRMPRGPVPTVGYNLTDGDNEYFEVKIENLDPEYKRYRFTPKKRPNLSLFDKKALEKFDLVLNILKESNANEVSDFTHMFRLWRTVKNGHKIPVDLFKLDEYEIAEIESALAYIRGKEMSKSVEREKTKNNEEYYELPDEPPDEDLMRLQFVKWEGDQDF